jgi:hypothetical protein
MTRKYPLALLTLVAVAAFPSTVHANANTADADCAGVAFNMPKGETDTVVTTTLNGQVVRTDTISTFGAPLAFSVASPDQTRPHVWTITVDSRWNDDTMWTETVPACSPPVATTTTTTTTTSTTTSTTLPNPSTTTSTTVPTQPTTVVTTPRPTPTTTTPPPFELPETGADHWGLLAIGATAFAVGVVLRRLVERS